MIKYDIIVNHPHDQKNTKVIVKPGDTNFHEIVFQRNLKACQYTAGQRVKQRGGHIRGTILSIERDITKINWSKHKPMFVEVLFDDKTHVLCNPSQLKRTK
jgi:hypothetical protein